MADFIRFFQIFHLFSGRMYQLQDQLLPKLTPAYHNIHCLFINISASDDERLLHQFF
jgi:hypothetical protein